MGALAPAFLAGLAAIAIPVLIHLIHRERKETVAFPSLMFLRKIPYRSVRRQKLRHLLLLAMRALALAILAFAFARPFLKREVASAAGTDGREVVILLDRSYSMAYGTRWDRALAAARTVAGEIRTGDHVSLVTFGASAEQLVSPGREPARLLAVLETLRPASDPTRFAAGFRMAAQILASSEMPRREIVLISDFHRFGFTANDDVALPPRTSVKTVDVSRGETEDAAVTSVAVARRQEGSGDGRAQATVTARITNLGTAERVVSATLEMAGRRVETKRVPIGPRASAQVAFAPIPVGAAETRAVVRLGADSQPSNDRFFFTVSEAAGASALIVEPPAGRARPNQSLFLARALSVADDPAIRVDVRSRVAPDDLRDRSLVVLNEADLPAGAAGERLRALVRAGGVLVVAPGERAIVPPEWQAVLPARAADVTTRNGSLGYIDFSNALFEPFRTARVDFSSVSVTRYRTLTPAADAQVIARLDDGAPALVDRAHGEGRIMMAAVSLDASWTDLPFHPLWVPLTHQLARRAVGGRETRTWFTVPHVLDLSREGNVIVESPGGTRLRVGGDSARPSLELRERGFYEVRTSATAIGAGRPVAVNVDFAESDLSHMDPAELVAAITARSQAGTESARPRLLGTPQELEQRQAIWWYLLVAALLVLAAETMLANRSTAPSAPAEHFRGTV